MGEKVKCEECGAKNNAGVRRCRVCANLLDIEAPEQRKGLALSLGELDAITKARALAEEEGLPVDNLIEFDRPGVAPIDVGAHDVPPPPPGEPLVPPPVPGARTPPGNAIEFDLPGVEPIAAPVDDEPDEPRPPPPPPPPPLPSPPPAASTTAAATTAASGVSGTGIGVVRRRALINGERGGRAAPTPA